MFLFWFLCIHSPGLGPLMHCSRALVRHVLHCTVSHVSQRTGILWLVKCIFVDSSMLLRCYFAFVLPILQYCSPLWGSAAECHLRLLEHQLPGDLVARLCPDQSCLWCYDIVWLWLACCTRLIQTLITVCSVSFHMLLLEFDILMLQLQLIHWSLKYQGVECPNLLDLWCQLRFECGMTFSTLF